MDPRFTLVAAPPRAVRGPLLLVDIGGYTAFLQSVAAAHRDDAFADGNVPDAYGLVSSLLDGIVDRMIPPFTLSKLEGDAVFAFAVEPSDVPRGPAFLACLAACYADFRERLAQAGDVWSCQCDACSRITTLDLKFVVHEGGFVIQSIAGREELVGSEVVLAHRLLKSSASDVTGHRAYAQLTVAAVSELEVPIGDATRVVERYDHYEAVETQVFPLGLPS
jgi:hypothetical protein